MTNLRGQQHATLTINGMDLAFGLRWARLATGKVEKEIRAEAAPQEKYAVRRDLSDAEGSRWQVGLTDQKALKGRAAAGGVLAATTENALAVQTISPNQIWVCAVVNGEVLPGYESVLDAQAANAAVERLVEDVLPEQVRTTYVIDEEAASLLEKCPAGEPISLADHLSGFEIPKSVLKANRIQSIGSGSSIYRTVGMCACLGAILYYLDLFPSEPEPAVAPLPAPKIKETKPSPEEILAAARKEELVWLAETFAEADGFALISALSDSARLFPRVWRGWQLKEIRWSAGQSGFSSNWVRLPGSTALIFQAGVDGQVQFTDQGNAATVNIPVDVSGPDRDPGEVSGLLLTREGLLAMNHELTLLDASWSSSVSDSQAKRPERISGLGNDPAASRRAYPVSIYDLKVDGEGLSALQQTGKAIDKLKAFAPTSAVMELDDGVRWEISGELYAR